MGASVRSALRSMCVRAHAYPRAPSAAASASRGGVLARARRPTSSRLTWNTGALPPPSRAASARSSSRASSQSTASSAPSADGARAARSAPASASASASSSNAQPRARASAAMSSRALEFESGPVHSGPMSSSAPRAPQPAHGAAPRAPSSAQSRGALWPHLAHTAQKREWRAKSASASPPSPRASPRARRTRAPTRKTGPCGEKSAKTGASASFCAAAARAAAAQKLALAPVFALFSPHGPVFRVGARVRRARGDARGDGGDADALFARHSRFCAVCAKCGHSAPRDWAELGARGAAPCAGCGARGADELIGPLWTGPLSNSSALELMAADARARGWAFDDEADAEADAGADRAARAPSALGALLAVLCEEARLEERADAARDGGGSAPVFHVSLDDVGRRARASTPPRDALAAALGARGYACARTHIDRKALRTDAPMSQCVAAARELDDAARAEAGGPEAAEARAARAPPGQSAG